jgi:hypothetical protein
MDLAFLVWNYGLELLQHPQPTYLCWEAKSFRNSVYGMQANFRLLGKPRPIDPFLILLSH